MQSFKSIYLRMNFSSSMSRSHDKSLVIKKMMIGAHLKIFLNYSQTITIINSLHLNWGEFVSNFFNVHNTVSGGFEWILTIECFINGSHFDFFMFYP